MSIEIKKSEKPVIYEDAKKIMEERLLNVDLNKSNELIWTLEHPDIYTAGTSYNENDILDKSIRYSLLVFISNVLFIINTSTHIYIYIYEYIYIYI